LAAEAVGGSEDAIGRTVEYSLGRRQFGRPIGSFQAYKHRCADAYQLLRLAQAGAFRAAVSLDGSDGDPALIRAAVRRGIPDCTHICGDAVQLHGAIGFSWESGLHSWLKRARSAELIAGSATPPEKL
jgi:alkylation response protein AidB-like acyl-CoA dehydrogenase